MDVVNNLKTIIYLVLAVFALAGIISAIAYKLTKDQLKKDFVSQDKYTDDKKTMVKDYENDMESINYKFYDREQLHTNFVEKQMFKTHVLNFDEKIDSLKEFIGSQIDGIKNLIQSKNV